MAWLRAGLEFGERRYWSMAQNVVNALIADPRFVTAKTASHIQARAAWRKR
jgi:hypothetical protein